MNKKKYRNRKRNAEKVKNYKIRVMIAKIKQIA